VHERNNAKAQAQTTTDSEDSHHSSLTGASEASRQVRVGRRDGTGIGKQPANPACTEHRTEYYEEAEMARVTQQLTLWRDPSAAEDPAFLRTQLITCIGNKRALLGPIGIAIEKVKRRLNKEKLRVLDAFSGSGIVSRFLKGHSIYIAANDIEDYAAVVGRCFLTNRSEVDSSLLLDVVSDINSRVDREPLPVGFIEELYAPRDENNISPEDRVFYTKRNARRLDNYRRLIECAPVDMRDLLLGPLLSEASVHANTAGVFKGFYKDRVTGIGQFGGTTRDALKRILADIVLEAPVLSRFECDYEVFQDDANRVVRRVKGFDLAYIDPPYNQHPYGSNYFMLNLIVTYKRPQCISRVSGIPRNWRRSHYNKRAKCYAALRDLLENIDAKYLLVSYNNEGFIHEEEMGALLRKLGKLEVYETRYNAFRGSRNLRHRSIHVMEYLFLVERG